MNITADISMYPLDSDYVVPIKAFIRRLRQVDGLQVVTNRLSTQVRGPFDTVCSALNECMREAMTGPRKVVFVTRYLNADLDIGSLPDID